MAKLPEYFVSLCLAQEGDVESEIGEISALARLCEQRLRYWEIIYVVGESHRTWIQASISKFANARHLRIVLVRDSINYYRRRAIGASEAIGDIIVLTAFNEVPNTEVIDFAEEAMASGRTVIGSSSVNTRILPIFYWIVGLISSYRIDARDLKTIAVPRNRLDGILARPTAAIELRFEPKRGLDSYLRKHVRLASPCGRTGAKERLELLVEIFSTSVGRFLTTYALASLVVSVIAASYGVWAVVVILIKSDVQPGWFSTALAQSGSAAFITLGLAVIALGIANLIERTNSDTRGLIVEELGNISFYDHVHDLNVEVGSE